MDRTKSVVTAKRFEQGMTFDRYLAWIATPENLRREGSMGPRRDWSGYLRAEYERARLTGHQVGSIRWLVAQPTGPRRILALVEEWSSDCRRDLPMVARLAEAGGLELRIFLRDGDKSARAPRPEPGSSPNADIMGEFLNEKNGQTWQSIPVFVFYGEDMRYLYHYIEYPAIYHKDRVVGQIRAARSGEKAEETRARVDREFFALQASPFFQLWACAGIDEMLSALHERLALGSLEG